MSANVAYDASQSLIIILKQGSRCVKMSTTYFGTTTTMVCKYSEFWTKSSALTTSPMSFVIKEPLNVKEIKEQPKELTSLCDRSKQACFSSCCRREPSPSGHYQSGLFAEDVEKWVDTVQQKPTFPMISLKTFKDCFNGYFAPSHWNRVM